jgi:hypothetical protein
VGEEVEMSLAGWCDGCGSYVTVVGAWMCQHGHEYSQVRNHYYIETGQPVCAPWLGYRTTPVSIEGYGETPGTKEAVLRAIAEAVVAQPGFAVTLASENELLIHMEDGFGRHRGFYEATVHVLETEHRLTAEDRLWYTSTLGFGAAPNAGEYWGWPRDMRLHWKLDLFGTNLKEEHDPLWWEYGNTQTIIDQTGAVHGWFVEWTKHRRRPDPGEWNVR